MEVARLEPQQLLWTTRSLGTRPLPGLRAPKEGFSESPLLGSHKDPLCQLRAGRVEGREALSAAAAVCGSLAFRRRGWQRACRHATTDCQEPSVTDALLRMPAELAAFRAALARSCGKASDVEAAVDGLTQWRSSLIQGQLPGDSNHTWPPEPLRRQLLMGLREIDLPTLLSEQPNLVDTVLLNVLQAVETFQKAVKASESRGDSQSNSSPSLWSFLSSASTAEPEDGSEAEPSEAGLLVRHALLICLNRDQP